MKTLIGNESTDVNENRMRARSVLSEIFEKRVVLVYTGQQRLAKNTLMQAIKYCAMSPLNQRDVVGELLPGAKNSSSPINGCTIDNLIDGAITSSQALQQLFTKLCNSFEIDSAFIPSGLVLANELTDLLGTTITNYWELKREMTKSSEPLNLKKIRECLSPYYLGWTLCGAGGGGFAVAVLKNGVSVEQFQDAVAQVNTQWISDSRIYNNLESMGCSVHTVSIDFDGITTRTIRRGGNEETKLPPVSRGKELLHEMLF